MTSITPKPQNKTVTEVAPSQDAASFQLDPNRLFHVTSGPDQGAILHQWHRYRYLRYYEMEPEYGPSVNEDDGIVGVVLIYPSGDTVKLFDKDAYNFLRVVKDRNAHLFDRRRFN